MLLVMLLLFATTGITLSKHYCMGRLMSIEINDHAQGCQDEDEDKMPCCENTTEELKVEQLQKTVFDIDLATNSLLIQEIAYVLSDRDPQEVSYPFVDIHSPPLIAKDIPLLVQRFLI